LKIWAKKDSRIKIKFLDKNKGIVENTNEALSLAKGEFIAFLDHDDLLAPFALFEILKKLQDNPKANVFYSDEDKIRQNGRRFDAFFKPDFSPDYLRSLNYMTHFMVIQKKLGDEIGWLQEGCDGAQDYDLILRATEKSREIVHIPQILYHWRVSSESTASAANAKPYANISGKKALQDHLKRGGHPAQVEDGYSSTWYRAQYQHAIMPLISIIISPSNHTLNAEKTINSILKKTAYPNYEIILIENKNMEKKETKLYKQIAQGNRIDTVKWEGSSNYSSANNKAVEQTKGEVLLFLDDAIQVINQDWLEEMLQFVLRSDVGAVGAKLYYPDDTIQHGGLILGIDNLVRYSHKHFPKNSTGYFGQLVLAHNISALPASCLMVRKQVFQEVGGFNKNYSLAFGDIDLSLKILEKKYLNVWTPYAKLYHHKSKKRDHKTITKKENRFAKEKAYFEQQWADFLEKGDPYYNPNLTLDREDFSIALK